MPQTTQCPECQVHLELPALAADQTVQCPRCRHLFAPVRPTVAVKRATLTPAYDDESMSEEPIFLARPKPLRGRWAAKLTIFLLFLSVISYGVQACLHYEAMRIEKKERELGGVQQRLIRGFIPEAGVQAELELDRRRFALEDWENLADPVHHAAFWLATIAFLVWLYCASSNAWNMHALGLYFVPETSPFAFLVAGANVYWSYLVLQEIWRASDPAFPRASHAWKAGPRSRVVIGWWLCFVAGMCLWFIRKPLGMEVQLVREPDLVAMFALVSHVIALVEGVLLILIIRSIMERQEERYERLCDLAV
jgi:hypothetical protein